MKTLDEATRVSGQDRQLLHDLKTVIRQHLPTAEIWLYGSVARGQQGPESDYDVLILTDHIVPKAGMEATEDAILAFELERDAVISTFYYSREEWDSPLFRVSPFRAEVQRDAILL